MSSSPKAGREILDDPLFPLDDWTDYTCAQSRGRQMGDDHHSSRGLLAGGTSDNQVQCPADSGQKPKVLQVHTHFAGVW